MDKAAAITILVALASVGLSSATIYTVGDEAGWSFSLNVSYSYWASTKHFEVGDVLRFVYKTTAHSVLMVTREDYLACNIASPVRSFHSGDDSITLPVVGNYFICGIPGHYGRGQKFRVFVDRLGVK